MAYNKAKGGGVPRTGNPLTSSIYGPKQGIIDQPQNLGGTMMGLGARLDSELISNISPGAGTKGGGSHEPIIKDDSAKAVGGRSINPPYNTIRTIIGASGAVAAATGFAGKYTSFVASHGAGADIDGNIYPPEKEELDSCDRAAMNAKFGYDYLPDCEPCCDTWLAGPCRFEFDVPHLEGLRSRESDSRWNGWVDPHKHKNTILRAIKACIDHTQTYSRGDPIVWLEPAALTFLKHSEYTWANPSVWHDIPTWDGSRFTFESIYKGLGEPPLKGKMDDNAKLDWADCKYWSDPSGNIMFPALEGLVDGDLDYEADYTWEAGSDLDKVLKQFIKQWYFDDPVGGGARNKLDHIAPLEFADTNELLQILNSSGDPNDIRPRWWGGPRSEHQFGINILSKTEVIEEIDMGEGMTTPVPAGWIIKFKWGYTPDHPCQSRATLSNEVTVNAYRYPWNGSWVNAPIIDTGLPADFNTWTVNLVGNVWAVIKPMDIQAPEDITQGFQSSVGLPVEYQVRIPEYARVEGGEQPDNGFNCIAGRHNAQKCECASNWRLEYDCDCWPEMFAIPEVTNNTNFEDFDSTWPKLRESHGTILKAPCICWPAGCTSPRFGDT